MTLKYCTKEVEKILSNKTQYLSISMLCYVFAKEKKQNYKIYAGNAYA